VTIDEFKNVDLRVGKIISAEQVEGSEKLLKLQVDVGEATPRQILSGIAKSYASENMVGKQVVLVANLEPRTLMGMESQGMLLAAHGEGGVPIILTIDGTVPPGSSIS
jgi:methionyl-tRNA synthetase